MGFWPWLIGAIIVGGAITAAMNGAQGTELQKRFVSLGDLAGKTRAEIVNAVGPPSSISSVGEGKTLLQWQAEGYHIALLFEGEICEGVTHEHANQ